LNKFNMFTKSLILLLAAGLLSAGRVPHPFDERIACGFNTPIERNPWQVSLVITNSRGCSGVIYSEDVVLTTAHCVRGRSPSDISVSFGSSTWGEGNKTFVHEVIVHDGYSPEATYGSNANDVAVLRLRTPIPLGKNALPINIATETPKPGQWAQITGWGTTHDGATDPGTVNLQGAYVQIEDQVTCQTAYSDSQPSCSTQNVAITEDMICANGMGKGPCAGDEGGPLVSVPGNQLIGLSSWNSFCAHPLYPDVYSNVIVLNDWIQVTAHFA
ncbi:hypothetical protein KR084_002712, partial [Drosophila pseudotakahashii]